MNGSKISVEKPNFTTCLACHLTKGDWFIPARRPGYVGLVIDNNTEKKEWTVMYIGERCTDKPECFFDVISYSNTDTETYIRVNVNMSIKVETI